jgi:hypothetical protein
MKRNRKGMLTGAIFMFAGLVSIPLAYKFLSLLTFSPLSTFLAAMIPAVLMGGGLLLIYVTNMLHNPYVDNASTATANDQSGTVPDDTFMTNVPKQIVIDINDNGISLKTGGMSPQEIIVFLELSKHYVIGKSIRNGMLIDIVKRE